jgi:hypothetical protein
MPNYRAYQLKPDGHIDGVPTIITCDDDQAAIKETKALVDGKDIELWDGTRLVITIRSKARCQDGRGSRQPEGDPAGRAGNSPSSRIWL